MKKNTFKILFHIRGNYKNKEGKCPITIRIAMNGEYERINSTVCKYTLKSVPGLSLKNGPPRRA